MMLDVLVIVQTLPSSNHINARYQGCQLGANANAEAARAPKQQTTRAPCFHTPYKSRMDRWMMGRKIVIGCEPYVQRNKLVWFGTKLPQLQCRPCGQKWTTIEKITCSLGDICDASDSMCTVPVGFHSPARPNTAKRQSSRSWTSEDGLVVSREKPGRVKPLQQVELVKGTIGF